jgi:hypothetical protein
MLESLGIARLPKGGAFSFRRARQGLTRSCHGQATRVQPRGVRGCWKAGAFPANGGREGSKDWPGAAPSSMGRPRLLSCGRCGSRGFHGRGTIQPSPLETCHVYDEATCPRGLGRGLAVHTMPRDIFATRLFTGPVGHCSWRPVIGWQGKLHRRCLDLADRAASTRRH